MLTQKYRPKTFSEVIGQDHIVKNLQESILKDSVHSCYMFSGPQGTGKTTVARIFSKAINCLSKVKPCNDCDGCKRAEIIEINASSERGIDMARKLGEIVMYSTKSKYRCVILDESHALTKEAAQSLLKTIEEPPSKTVFILCSTQPTKIIQTIQSRAKRYTFKRVFGKSLLNYLHRICISEKISIDDGTLWDVCSKSKGILRDALTYLEMVRDSDSDATILQSLGTIAYSEIKQLFEVLLVGSTNGALHFIEQIHNLQPDYNELYISLMQAIYSTVLSKSGVENENQYGFKELENLSLPTLFDILALLRDEHRQNMYEGALSEINFNLTMLKLKNMISVKKVNRI